MGSSIKDNLRSHTFVEMCKLEVLDVCRKTLDELGLSMTKNCENHILKSVVTAINEYKLDGIYDINSYGLVSASGDETDELYVKASEVTSIFSEMQGRILQMLVDIIMCDLSLFLAKEGYDG